MNPKRNTNLFPIAGLAVAALFIGSMSLPWGGADFDFSDSLLSFMEAPPRTYTAWALHDSWDQVVAFAAAFAVAANALWLIRGAGERDSTPWVAFCNIAAGAVATLGVVVTMADPPTPPIVDLINNLPGLPEIIIGARYGIFVSLVLALTLIDAGVMQLVLGRRETVTDQARGQ